MRPLRAYLLVRDARVPEWSVQVHRDLESLTAGLQTFAGRPDFTAVIHVGFDRPDIPHFEEICARFSGRVLVTASARYAFPGLIEVAPISPGDAAHVPLFVALDGWGYTCTAEELGLSDETIDPWESGPLSRLELAGWVAALAEEDSTLAETAIAAGISNDTSYLICERTLATADRIALALFRLRQLTGTKEPDDPILIVRHGPEWLANRLTSSLDLTVRITNVFSEHNITKVSDLLEFASVVNLLAFGNFGRKSVADLCRTFLYAIHEGPDGTAHARNGSDTLLTIIKGDISELPPRVAYILKRRMGLDTPAATLQEIGDELKITRERVRQVEAKYIGKLKKKIIWPLQLSQKLESILNGRTEPVPFQALDVFDIWFSGTGGIPECTLICA